MSDTTMIEDDELRSLFHAESDEHISALEAGLLALEQGRGDAATLDQVFRDAHSLKGAARMLELQDIEMLMHGMEEVLRSARDRRQAPDAAALKVLFPALDAARALAHEAISGKPSGVVLQDLVGGLQTTKVAEPQVVAADDSTHTEPVPESVPESVPDLVRESVSGSPPSADRPTTADAPADVGGDGVPYQIDTIRVDTRKLDDLLRLCGELIVTQQRAARIEDGLDRLNIELNELRQEMLRATRGATDAMPWTEQLAELSARAGGLRDRLGEDSGKLQDLTQQLSDGVRNTRLLPLATLFALFPRMVRDIAQQESKQVELVIEGGATQADKQVIEQLKDPLMHVLRNAVHHGIETPEQRRIAGKPERGMIRISAQRLGSVLHIEVGDDGRGVDSGQVRSALRRLSSGRREATTDDKAKVGDDGHPEAREHLLESLFLPGLTTEQMITDVSGRGVGLDVVRTSIDALKGSIQARSTPGDGFQLALELPGTLATTRILLLQVG